LVVIQDANLDGYYTGSINGGQGIFEKQGAGALALMGTSSTIGQIDVTGGKIIANVQSLGYGRVVLGPAGTLSIVQNNAGTLRAQINGLAGSVLTVAPTDTIVNSRSGDATIGNGQLGVNRCVQPPGPLLRPAHRPQRHHAGLLLSARTTRS